jgi:hypothetical protein
MADKKYINPKESAGDDFLHHARERFEIAWQAENHNRLEGELDLSFARLGEQWPTEIRDDRLRDRRPILTINKLPAYIRQVVNDARMNKPAIKVRPVDSSSDPQTADVINGLIRNIETVSNADIAYDTAVESAASNGFGYIRVGMDYAYDDAFEMDLSIDRVLNPFSVYGDPNATSADGSDWMEAFIVDRVPKDVFEDKYGEKANVDFDGDAWSAIRGSEWLSEEGVLIAEYWQREETEREIVMLNDGRVFSKEQLETDEDLASVRLGLTMGILSEARTRMAKTYKVKQTLMSGADVLEKRDWPGRYIPIAPVYGEEFAVKGRRYFRSLINPAKDAQRMHNYWRTTATELVALAPRVPWIGRKGTFDSDMERWSTANTQSHAYLEFDTEVPQRMPLDSGIAAGALQEALNASDDMKAIIGMYDASLGARSNETSGRAIMARQREGDVSTFHFIDNLSRAIRHVGKILIDLIPHVYNEARMIRVLNEDLRRSKPVVINQQAPETDEDGKPITDEQGNPVMAMHDLTAGKYDLVVEAGPSFTTRREEAATQMIEMLRSFPDAAPVIGDLLAQNLDWPQADEIAKRLAKINPANQDQQIPPQLQEQIQKGLQRLRELEAENAQLKQQAGIDAEKVRVDQFEAQTNRFEAETGRMEAAAKHDLDMADRMMPRGPAGGMNG